MSMPKENRRDILKHQTTFTIDELNAKYNFVNWSEYLERALSPPKRFENTEQLIVRDEPYFERIGGVVNETKKRVLANYLIWRTVQQSIAFLTKDVRMQNMKFEKILKGRNKMLPRWKYCTSYTTTA